MSEVLKDGTSFFSETGMPDMSDSAWLAIKIPAGTSKNETMTEAQSSEPLPKDVDNLLVTVSFSLDEETIQQICSNPNPTVRLKWLLSPHPRIYAGRGAGHSNLEKRLNRKN